MKLGAICFFTEYSISPAELGTAIEQLGFDSLWVGEHSHIPLEPGETEALDTRTGKPVPRHYSHLLDPFVALTHAAAATTRIGLGTSICLVNERDVITTAKTVASLDALSGGRFVFGVGAGWNEREMLDHGTDPSIRYPLLREKLEAMKQIWTREVSEYRGDYVEYGRMVCHPKPTQQPHPPIYIGGNWKNIPRVVEYADGWIPSTSVAPAETFLPHIETPQRAAKDAGRGPIPVTALHTNATDVESLDVDSEGAFTDRDWEEWAAAGVERCVLIIPPDRDRALRMIEHYARFVGQ